MKKLLILFLYLFVNVAFATGIGNVATAPCDNDTLSKYTGTANVEINWEPNTIGLKWFNGDQQIAGQTSCVYDGTITVPPQPTKPGYTFNGWKVMSAVPEGYTELKYLEATTRTQYIDTGIVPVLNYSIEVKAKKQQSQSLFGSSNIYNLTGSAGDTSQYFYLGSSTRQQLPVDLIDNSVSHIWGFDAQGGKIYCDNLVVNVTVGNTAPTEHLYLFCRSKMGDMDCGNHQIYYVKLWDASNQLIFHGIPARRNSDGVLGMYDSISGNFFTNAGTGTFTAGPVAN